MRSRLTPDLQTPATADTGEQFTAQLRRLVFIPSVLGGALMFVFYGLDPVYGGTFYPQHSWSTYGVVAGWCLLLAGLAAVAPSLVSRWIAGISALAIIAAPGNPGAAEIALSALGFSGCAFLLLLAGATVVVRRYGWKGRVVWSIGLFVMGAAVVSGLGYSFTIFDHPGRQLFGSLLASPIFIGLASLWVKLDRAPAQQSRTAESSDSPADVPATLMRRLLAGFLSWVLFAVVNRALQGVGPLVTWISPTSHTAQTLAQVVTASSIAACVAILQVVPTALRGQTPGQLITGLHVVRVDNGAAPGWLRSVVRSGVFLTVPILGVIYFLSWAVYVRLGLGKGVPERVAWDHASGTAVVRRPSKPTAKQPPPERPIADDRPSTWQSYD